MALDGKNEFEELLERSAASIFKNEEGKIHFHDTLHSCAVAIPNDVCYSFIKQFLTYYYDEYNYASILQRQYQWEQNIFTISSLP